MPTSRLLSHGVAYLSLGLASALAQVTAGTILGTVADSSGAVIPGATVQLRNVETGITRTVTTDAAGRYRAPQLGLGTYEVTRVSRVQLEVGSGGSGTSYYATSL